MHRSVGAAPQEGRRGAGQVKVGFQPCACAAAGGQDPVDLRTIGERVGARFYTTLEMFAGTHLLPAAARAHASKRLPSCTAAGLATPQS